MLNVLVSKAFGIINFILFLILFGLQAFRYDSATPIQEKRLLKAVAVIALALYNAIALVFLVHNVGYYECDIRFTGFCPTSEQVVRFAFIIMSVIFTFYEEIYKRFTPKRPARWPLHLFETVLSLYTIVLLWFNIWWFSKSYERSAPFIIRFILDLARVAIAVGVIRRFGKKWSKQDTLLACLGTVTVVIALLWQLIVFARLVWWSVPSLYLELSMFQLMAISRMRYSRRNGTANTEVPDAAPEASYA